MKFKIALFACLGLILPLTISAQSNDDVEEVVVVGSQIKGAKITEIGRASCRERV